MVTIEPVHHSRVYATWPLVERHVEIYRSKTPHDVASPGEILRDLCSGQGDELVLIKENEEYRGFITFRVVTVDREPTALVAMIYSEPGQTRDDILLVGTYLFKSYVKLRGCKRISFFTARKGFQRLARHLGFEPRIIEWTMEV